MNHLIYKNYHGSIEYSKEDKLMYGKVLGIKSLISYEGKTGDKLEKDFKEAVDFYLSDCEDRGVEPEVAFKGSFNVRVPRKVHMALALQAKANMTSLNSFVRNILEQNLMANQGARAVEVKKLVTVSKVSKARNNRKRGVVKRNKKNAVRANNSRSGKSK